MPAYRARSKAHLLEMLIDDAERLKGAKARRVSLVVRP
jgi:hypothetical protein